MERFARYRDEIRRMPEEDFAYVRLSPEEKERAKRAVTPQSAAEFVHKELGNEPVKYQMNADYLRARKNMVILKAVVDAVLVLGLVIWGYFMLRR